MGARTRHGRCFVLVNAMPGPCWAHAEWRRQTAGACALSSGRRNVTQHSTAWHSIVRPGTSHTTYLLHQQCLLAWPIVVQDHAHGDDVTARGEGRLGKKVNINHLQGGNRAALPGRIDAAVWLLQTDDACLSAVKDGHAPRVPPALTVRITCICSS